MDDIPATSLSYDEISKKRLSELIHHLRPNRQMYAGRRFFECLLESNGVEGVLAFLGKASEILDKQQELEVHDFSDNGELEAFCAARPQWMSRRHFFGVLAEGGGGAALALLGCAGIGHQTVRLRRGQSLMANQDPPEDAFQAAERNLEDTVMPTAYAAIGAGMVYAAFKNNRDNKLSDIGNAVGRLWDRLEAEKKRLDRHAGGRST